MVPYTQYCQRLLSPLSTPLGAISSLFLSHCLGPTLLLDLSDFTVGLIKRASFIFFSLGQSCFVGVLEVYFVTVKFIEFKHMLP